MNRKEAAELLPIIKAFAEGRPIQYRIKDNKSAKWDDVDKNYHEFSPHSFMYRIKPEPKYRPFKNAEECWQEMQKHQPFGWVKEKEQNARTVINYVHNDGVILGCGPAPFKYMFGIYTFADGIPFGIKVEE